MKFLIIVGLAITSSVFAEGPEQNYSNYALSLANKYRSKSMTGIKGIALLSLACFLDPENDEAVLVQMNNTKPKKPKKNLNEEKLLLAFLKRADDIRLNLYPKNEDAAVVASAYYLIVELFKPVNHQIILGLGAFKADDQAYTIDTVFETKINPVTALNKRGIKPYRARGVGSKTDKKIADLIARKAAQLLSKNKTDTKAIQMLGVAGYIDPMNKTFLLTAGLLSKDKIEKQNLARIDLIPALELRAKKLFSGKSKKAIQ
ncbi:MAG: hypothetical protein HRT89_25350, partial [Lentisphaeria bacterium]|nr:hypothetical protein [Lentisphaeria bacterium]